MPALEKGSSVKSSYEAVRHVLGDVTWESVLSSLDPNDAELVRTADKQHFIPIAVTGRVYSAVCRVACGGDRNSAERLLRSAGHRDANDMLDGVFSIFARFVSPQQAFKRAGSIISSVYTGIEHETAEDTDGRGGTLRLRGFSDSPFASCVISGWMESAMRRFGAENPSVQDVRFASGLDAADELVFVLRW